MAWRFCGWRWMFGRSLRVQALWALFVHPTQNRQVFAHLLRPHCLAPCNFALCSTIRQPSNMNNPTPAPPDTLPPIFSRALPLFSLSDPKSLAAQPQVDSTTESCLHSSKRPPNRCTLSSLGTPAPHVEHSKNNPITPSVSPSFVSNAAIADSGGPRGRLVRPRLGAGS